MTLPSSLRNLWLSLAILLLSTASYAQVANYDPEYDDETAAGTVDNAAQGGNTTQGPNNTENVSEPADTGGEAAVVDEASIGVDDEGLYAEEIPVEAQSNGKDVAPWDWGGRRAFPTFEGSTGLYYTTSALSDESGTFGMGIHGGIFSLKDYLTHNDKNTNMWAGLTLRVTPWDYIELFAGLQSRSNYNSKSNPKLFQSLGDFNIGLKGFYPVADFFSIGGLFALEFKNPVGEVNVSFKGMSFPLGLVTSFDASKLNEQIPIKLHLNFIYRFDNTAQLVEDVELARGGCDTDYDGDGKADYEGCLNSVERTALGIDRMDQFRIGAGLEATVPYVTPLLEFTLEVPVNRQGFVCPREADTVHSVTCMDKAGFSGMRKWLTFGVRILPPIKTMTIDLGVDYGLRGYAPSVHEMAAQAPYRVLFGLTYNFDPFPKPVVETVTEPCPPPPPPPAPAVKPVVVGFVHDAASGSPLLGARVVYRNKGFSAQLSGADGKFVSYGMDPGEITVDVTLDGYENGSFNVTIPDTQTEAGAPTEVALKCPLKKRPDMAKLKVRVVSDSGEVLPGVTVKLSGPKIEEGKTGATGIFSYEGLIGPYKIKVNHPGYFDKERSVNLTADQEMKVEVPIVKMPDKPNVELTKKTIRVKRKIHFETGTNAVSSRSAGIMMEIAHLLKNHPEVSHVEIQGHTDNQGRAAANREKSQQQADSIRQYLINEGIAPSRLTAKGFGADRPRAPNITASGRSKNRRIEFRLK